MTNLDPPKITIDSYPELIVASLEHMKIVSNGEMSDVSPSGFMRPFSGTLAFVASETLYRANLAAEAAAKSFLSEVVGIPEDVGVAASVTLEFGLTAQLTSPFTIPNNFQVSDSSGAVRFYTDENLVIPAGGLAGTVTATAETVGVNYNLNAGLITKFANPLTYLSYVRNPVNASGGREKETPNDLIERAAIAIRTRNPVSSLDFEQLAALILGEGSRAKAIGLLAADKLTVQLGAIHLFLLNPNGSQPTQAQMSSVGQKIATRLMLGCTLITSPIETFPISVDAIVNADVGESSEAIASNCFSTLKEYFATQTATIGGEILIEEVKYLIRNTGGLTLDSVEINGGVMDISLPTTWTIPTFTGINIQVISGEGTYTSSLFIPSVNE